MRMDLRLQVLSLIEITANRPEDERNLGYRFGYTHQFGSFAEN
jgi:hypothetical protein